MIVAYDLPSSPHQSTAGTEQQHNVVTSRRMSADDASSSRPMNYGGINATTADGAVVIRRVNADFRPTFGSAAASEQQHTTITTSRRRSADNLSSSSTTSNRRRSFESNRPVHHHHHHQGGTRTTPGHNHQQQPAMRRLSSDYKPEYIHAAAAAVAAADSASRRLSADSSSSFTTKPNSYNNYGGGGGGGDAADVAMRRMSSSHRSHYSTTTATTDTNNNNAPTTEELFLDFSQILIGRQEELDTLHRAFDRVQVDGGVSSVCLIEGLSGTGKSTLFRQFVEQLLTSSHHHHDHHDNHNNHHDHDEEGGNIRHSHHTNNKSSSCSCRPHVLSGKFEEWNEDPLSAIAEAYSGVLKKIMLEDNDEEEENYKEYHHASGGGIYDSDDDDKHEHQMSFPSLKKRITEQLQGHAKLLASILPDPELKDFILDLGNGGGGDDNNNNVRFSCERSVDISLDAHEDDSSSDEDDEVFRSDQNRHNSLNRMKYMFKELSVAIATPERPIILFLDDLQWCDALSLEFLKTLLLDKELKYFFVVGAYRSDESIAAAIDAGEEKEDYIVNQHWQSLERANKSVVKIKLENLSVQQLGDFLKRALLTRNNNNNNIGSRGKKNMMVEDEFRFRELAATLHPKTRGNIFFTRQVLEELYMSGTLTFSLSTSKWEWNIGSIEFSDNVLGAVTHRINNNTSSLLRHLLTVAAYMRRTVDVFSLKAMMDLEGKHKLSYDEVVAEMKEAVTLGFLISKSGSNEYSFAHDRIQQAFYELIPEGEERDEFRFSVGSRLYTICKNKSFSGLRDWMIYAAADHFNATKHVENPLFRVSVNLKAGKKCMSVAAFQNASKYFAFALRSIHEIKNFWDEQYKVALELYECMVEAELIQGHLDVGQGLAETLLAHAHNIDDKLPTQLSLAKAFGRERSHKTSFELSRSALRSMKMYPKTSVGVKANLITDLLYVRRYFQKHSDEEILNLPKSNDKRLTTAMELYENTLYQGWFCQNVVEFLAGTLRSLRATFKFGLNPRSGASFMAYFMFCDNLGDKMGAHRFARLGLQIMSRGEDKTAYCLHNFTKIFFLDAWSKNIQAVMDRYDLGYKSGMENGDFENGLMSRSAKLDHQYSAGHHLEIIETGFADLIDKEVMLKMASVKRITVHQNLVVEYLRGDKGKDGNIDFDALLEFDKNLAADGSDSYPQIYAFRSALQIAVYWGNHNFAKRLIEKEVTMNDEKSHSVNALRLFFLALAHANLYLLTGKSSFRKRSRVAVAELKSFSRAKGMNSWHRCMIAEAHLKGCGVTRGGGKGKTDSVLKGYVIGIDLSQKRNHIQDAGLSAQLAAEYLMHADSKDTNRIKKYLNFAMNCYRDWGATNLVQHLENKYTTRRISTTTATVSTMWTAAEASAGDDDGQSSSLSKSIDHSGVVSAIL